MREPNGLLAAGGDLNMRQFAGAVDKACDAVALAQADQRADAGWLAGRNGKAWQAHSLLST